MSLVVLSSLKLLNRDMKAYIETSSASQNAVTLILENCKQMTQQFRRRLNNQLPDLNKLC